MVAEPGQARVYWGPGSDNRKRTPRLQRGSPCRVAAGRARPGANWIARSYEEAREGLTIAASLKMDVPVVESRDSLLYRVLFRKPPRFCGRL